VRDAPTERLDMCNLYSVTKGQQAIRELVKAVRDLTDNLPLLPALRASKPPSFKSWLTVSPS